MKNKNIIKQEKELKLTVSTITRNEKKIYYNNLLSEKSQKCAETSSTTTLQTIFFSGYLTFWFSQIKV